MTANRTLGTEIRRLARVYKYRDHRHASYLFNNPQEKTRRSNRAVVYAIYDSADGRATLHPLRVKRVETLGMAEWSGWIQVHVPDIMRASVLAYLNRRYGSVWRVRGIVGWHMRAPE